MVGTIIFVVPNTHYYSIDWLWKVTATAHFLKFLGIVVSVPEVKLFDPNNFGFQHFLGPILAISFGNSPGAGLDMAPVLFGVYASYLVDLHVVLGRDHKEDPLLIQPRHSRTIQESSVNKHLGNTNTTGRKVFFCLPN